jgi:hypothetical protein
MEEESCVPPGAWAVVDDVTGRSTKAMLRRPFAPFVVVVRTRGVITNAELEAEVREVLQGNEKIWGGLGGMAVPDNVQIKGGLALPRWNIGVNCDERPDFFVKRRRYTWRQYLETAAQRKTRDYDAWNLIPEMEWEADDDEREQLAAEKMEEVKKQRDASHWKQYDEKKKLKDKKAKAQAGRSKGR